VGANNPAAVIKEMLIADEYSVSAPRSFWLHPVRRLSVLLLCKIARMIMN